MISVDALVFFVSCGGLRFAHFTHSDGDKNAAKKFLKHFKKKYGRLPTIEWTALQGHGAAAILLRVISGTKKIPSSRVAWRKNLQTAIKNTEGFKGICGDIDIRADIDWQMYTLKGGQEKPL